MVEDSTAEHAWAAMLDAFDYGVLLVDRHGRIQHANRAALARLNGRGDSRRCSDLLPCGGTADAAQLDEAVEAAITRGLRRLVMLGRGSAALGVAILPLPGAVALLMLSRGHVCEPLSVHWYGRSHGLTAAEARVLGELCAHSSPAEIAVARGVALSTIRAQISTIRAKTGASSIRDLVSSVARLPPIVCALGLASRAVDGGSMPAAAGAQLAEQRIAA